MCKHITGIAGMLEPDLYGPCQVAGHQRLTFLNAATVVDLAALSFRYGELSHLYLFNYKEFELLKMCELVLSYNHQYASHLLSMIKFSLCLQILPQLLYYFGVQNDVNSLDWSTIVIYTCEASCDESMAYKEEFAWVQLPSQSTATLG